MNYEKKYKEALANMQELYNSMKYMSSTDALHTTTALENAFSELKESEDEKTRKELISFLQLPHQQFVGERKQERWIAWLEKQVEQKPIRPVWKYKKDNTPLLRDSFILNKYGCVAKSPSGALVSDVWVLDFDELAKLPKEEFEKQGEQKETLCDKCKREQSSHSCQDIMELGRCALEHQSKQKPTDKVEPKFKVGDWVVSNRTNKTYKIDSIDTKDANYIIYSCVPSVYIDEDSPCFSESMIHFWTIKDAKDGDVLTSHECLVLFKNIDGFNIKCYCTYHSLNNPRFYVDTLQNKNAFHPATKEQRDLLFQKMKEAGYEWDVEKKELKKIEQKPVISNDALREGISHFGITQYQINWLKKYVQFEQSIQDGDNVTDEDDTKKTAKKKFLKTDGIMDNNGERLTEEYIQEKSSKFHIGDKVKIHCCERPKHIRDIYNNKLGNIDCIWDLNKNPWGNIGVRLENGCNNSFFESELEIVDKTENQCEQKPADKVEPKFKVGDWIVKNGKAYLIDHIDTEKYFFSIGGYTHEFLNWELISNADEKYHLWTIQDAKDGDVLVWDNSKCIALFKNIYDEESFNSHGYVGGCTGEFEPVVGCHDIGGAHPATKEQRDLLFQKMKEAGYEWDAETNMIKRTPAELAKIEDEKIAKELIRYLPYCDDISEDTKERWIAWLEKQGTARQLYVRFGDIPDDEKSKIYRGDEGEIGEEDGVSVYPAFEVDGNIVLGLNLPITQTTLHTQQHLLEYDDRPCYLVSGDYVGKGVDGEPLIRNVSIIKQVDNYRIKEPVDKHEPKLKVGECKEQ